MKTCNAGVKTAEECQQLNKAHRQLGLNIVIQPEESSNNPGVKEIVKLCLHSLNIAREFNYKAMQYNFVISSNQRAVKLWKKCGFQIVGELPEAFFSPTYGYVNVYVMYQKL